MKERELSLTLMVRGGTFFGRLFLHEKRGLEISWLFLIRYKLSENQEIFFLDFTVFLGDLEGAGTLPPRAQATFNLT